MSVAYNLPISLERWERLPVWERDTVVDELDDLIEHINEANAPGPPRRSED